MKRTFAWWAARLSCRALTLYVFLGYGLSALYSVGRAADPPASASVFVSALVLVSVVALFGTPFVLAVIGFVGGLYYHERSTVGFAIFGLTLNGFFLRFLTELSWWNLWAAFFSRNLP